MYEKRLIEKYIQEDGKCPISGETIENSDLVALQGIFLLGRCIIIIIIIIIYIASPAYKAIRPRAVNATSIPGMLAQFQVFR